MPPTEIVPPAAATSASELVEIVRDRSETATASLWPGLLLTGTIAAVAFALRLLPALGHLSPMILSIVIGVGLQNVVGTPRRAVPGVAFSLRRVLRIAIVLLGLQLTVAQLIEVGAPGLGLIAVCIAATLGFTVWLGKLLGVDLRLATLIGTGTAICGASAVVAANTVVGGSDEDSAYAIASVTLFGTLAMVVYPLLVHPLGLDAQQYGLWAGASIHEIAQVVAATFQISPDAGHVATIVKLSRVMMLAPVVVAMGLSGRFRRGDSTGTIAAAPIPWFVFGFLALIVLGSVVSIPPVPMHWIVEVTTFLLSMALAAMGLHTDIRKLSAEGVRPFILCAASSGFLSVFSLVLIRLFL
jgi:uncharacterized integral membrane protein (TIGR00698 family)